jgi:two-component system chemotaxis response regulator CheB
MLSGDSGARCAVAVGASAGGVPVLRELVAALPADLPAAVLVVLHLDPRARSLLPALLRTATALRVVDVRDEAVVEAGAVYVGIPDRHLFVAEGRIRLGISEPVHHFRPSIDYLFESVAAAWRRAAIGVILTGNGSDGARGIVAVKEAGGATFAQDPREAPFPGMPQAAIATGHVDSILSVVALGEAITRAVTIVAATEAA